MSGTTVLRAGRTRLLDQLWADFDVDAAAELVASQLTGAGAVLPLTVFLGSRVYPIVAWDKTALDVRLQSMRGPVIDPTQIEGVMTDPSVPTVLQVVGFIGVGRPTKVRVELSGLRGMARTIGMFPAYPRQSPLLAADYDVQGSALVVVDDDGIDVRVGGDGSARAGSDLAPIWRRVFEERLFWWALQFDRWPED